LAPAVSRQGAINHASIRLERKRGRERLPAVMNGASCLPKAKLAIFLAFPEISLVEALSGKYLTCG
jgi:hypothetical protein